MTDNNLKTRAINRDVLYAAEGCRTLSDEDISELAAGALTNPSGKLRICLHRSPNDTLHEMLVALRKDVKYPPHCHMSSEESYLALYGSATLYIYTDSGIVHKSIPFDCEESGRLFYARLPAGTYHYLDIKSDVFVFLETKLGPFDPQDNVIASFGLPVGDMP